MTEPTSKIRNAALVGIIGSATTVVTGLAVQAFIQPSTTISDERWSYPWSSDALVAASLMFALLHVLVIVGIVGLGRSGVAGQSRTARAGLTIAVTGTGMLFAAELASIPARHALVDDTSAGIVGGLFGLATLASAIGFLLLGAATLKAHRWQDWRRYTPLVTGIATSGLIGVSMTKAMPTAVAVYGLCLLAANVAVYTRPHGSTETPSPGRAQAQPA